MKVERVDKNKIKVLIDENEAKELNITAKMISQNTPEVQKMFWRAIRIAEENSDFSIDGAKLFVETIPSCESGIGMFITRVCTEGDLEQAISNCSYKGRLRRGELKPEGKAVRQRKYIYKFEDFDSVCAGAERLSGRYFGKSVLYKLENRFYLYLIPADALSACEADLLLTEFAERTRHGQYVHGKLNEYGEIMIAEGALEILTEYFVRA